MKRPFNNIDGVGSLPTKHHHSIPKNLLPHRRFPVKVEPVLEIERFEEAFTWSYIVYPSPPGQDKFEDVTTEHLNGTVYVTEQEIQQCQLAMWEMLRPGE